MKIQTKKQRQDIGSAMKMVNTNGLIIHELLARFDETGMTDEQKEHLEKLKYYCNNLVDAVDILWDVL